MAGTTSLVKMWVAGNIWKYKGNPDSLWLRKTKTEVQMISIQKLELNKEVTPSFEFYTSWFIYLGNAEASERAKNYTSSEQRCPLDGSTYGM